MARAAAVANDADLVQRVRSSLGRDSRIRGLRPNVSSCELVVTLHGRMGEEERRAVEEAVRRVAGVRDVANKILLAG